MKAFFNVISVFLTICGAIAGAGFLSGAEAVAFFGIKGFVFPLVITAAVFSFCLIILFTEEKLNANSEDKNLFCFLSVVADFILLCGMLAALDAAFNTLLPIGGFPFASLAALAFAFVYSSNSGKLDGINGILTPFSIIIVNLFASIALKDKLGCITPSVAANPSLRAIVNAFAYAFMNVFAAAPTIRRAASDKNQKTLRSAAILFGVYAFFQTFVIMAVVISTEGAVTAPLPLLSVFNGKTSILLGCAIFAGIFTSFYSYFLPVYNGIKARKGKKAACFTVLCAFALSRIGFSRAISLFYPAIGAIGAVWFIKTFIKIRSAKKKNSRIKRAFFSDNKNKTIKKGARYG